MGVVFTPSKVRDGVLAAAEPILTGATTREEAIARLTEAMPMLEAAAAAVITAADRNDPVAVTLGEESYPTRVYESCAFPAGTYVSLRVCIEDVLPISARLIANKAAFKFKHEQIERITRQIEQQLADRIAK